MAKKQLVISKDKEVPAQKRGRRVCFVISPIGEIGSTDRLHADKVLESIVKPALSALDIRPKRADGISAPDVFGLVVQQLADAPLAIAILTNFNPNVMFEVGVRMGWGLPVVLLLQAGTQLPFDLKSRYTVFYDMQAPKRAIEQLRTFLRSLANVERPTPDDGTLLGTAFRKLAGHYCLDSAIQAKVRLLQSMADRIEEQVLHDLNEDIKEGCDKDGAYPNALGSYAERIEKEFNRLSDFATVFEKIADHGEKHYISVSRCEPALVAMRDIHYPAMQLVRWLRKSNSSPKSFRQAQVKISKLVEGIESIVKQLRMAK